MVDQILSLLGEKDYVPLNVPGLLKALRLSPGKQQELQSVLRDLEQRGEIARTKAIVTLNHAKPILSLGGFG